MHPGARAWMVRVIHARAPAIAALLAAGVLGGAIEPAHGAGIVQTRARAEAVATRSPAARSATLPEPVLGSQEVLSPIAGTVTVRVKGATTFAPLTTTIGVPDGSEVDTARGRVLVDVATPQPGQSASAIAYQGLFVIHQDSTAPAETHFLLSQRLSGCGRPARLWAARASAGAATRRKPKSPRSRRLWVSDNGGSWGTGGRYVSTSVAGTRWLTLDECNRSLVKVAAGVVRAHDLIHNTFITVTAGHEYAAIAPTAESSALVPARGHVYTGVTGGSLSAFGRQVGKHPTILGYFATWNQPIGTPLASARANRARLLLHLSTDVGYGGGAGEVISPGAIANGAGDSYLLRLGEELAQGGQPAYVALLPEMNQANNAYCAFNAGGGRRDSSHSTGAYQQAWRRSVLILRGGAVAAIDRRLRALRLPAVHTSEAVLPSPRIAFMWAPQTAGTPEIPANGPGAYYPGSAYVDIVATDFYSAFPNFAGLARLYSAYPAKAFGFNEWAMWQSGDPGFVRQLFGFVQTHPRVAIMVYNQGLQPSGPFRLYRFPAATAEIRRQLSSSRFLPFAPEWASG